MKKRAIWSIETVLEELKKPDPRDITRNGTISRDISGRELYYVWVEAVKTTHKQFISIPPTAAQKKIAKQLQVAFLTFGSEDGFPAFLNIIISDWSDLCRYLADHRNLFYLTDGKLDYPEMAWIQKNISYIATWFKEREEQHKLNAERQARQREKQLALKSHASGVVSNITSNKSEVPIAPKFNRKESHRDGYTYDGNGLRYFKDGKENNTYEQIYVDAVSLKNKEMQSICLMALKGRALNKTASVDRIKSILTAEGLAIPSTLMVAMQG